MPDAIDPRALSALVFNETQRAIARAIQPRYPMDAVRQLADRVGRVRQIEHQPFAATVARGIEIASRRP